MSTPRVLYRNNKEKLYLVGGEYLLLTNKDANNLFLCCECLDEVVHLLDTLTKRHKGEHNMAVDYIMYIVVNDKDVLPLMKAVIKYIEEELL